MFSREAGVEGEAYSQAKTNSCISNNKRGKIFIISSLIAILIANYFSSDNLLSAVGLSGQ